MDDWLGSYVGASVVCDLDEYYLVIGRLEAISKDHLHFVDVDFHDHREANSTKEVYVIESRKLGIRTNRKQLAIPRHRLVAISRLEDVQA